MFLPSALVIALMKKWGIALSLFIKATISYMMAQIVIVICFILLSKAFQLGVDSMVGSMLASSASAMMEDILRYVALGFIFRTIRSKKEALSFGIGWSSAQMTLIGFGFLLSVILGQSMVSIEPQSLNASVEVTQSFEAIKQQTAGLTWILGPELMIMVVSGLSLQMLWTLLVMTSLKRRDHRWLILTIVSHIMINWVLVIFNLASDYVTISTSD